MLFAMSRSSFEPEASPSSFKAAAHAHPFFDLITDAAIERDDVLVGRPNLQIHFRTSQGPQPLFGGPYQPGGKAPTAMLGQDRQVVNPTAHAIEPGHHGAYDRPSEFAYQKELGLNPELVFDHDLGRVPRRVLREHAAPERAERFSVTWAE